MRLAVIEAVVWPACMLFEQLFRLGGPYVVVSRSEIEGIASVGHQKLIDLAPLRLCVFVVESLNGVTDADYERRLFGCDLSLHTCW